MTTAPTDSQTLETADAVDAKLSAEIAAMTPEELEAKLRRAGMKDDEPAL